jgi:hypothetical protein
MFSDEEQMKLEIITLSENKSHKEKYCMFSLICER